MSFDADAAAYITAVEAADNAALPTHIKNAIDDFVIGCKADGIWSAIKAACFLAGPATLAGALVPLVGLAPTNIGGNFVSGDYNQLTGLIGNGSNKALDTNRNNNADGQNNVHQTVWVSSAHVTGFGAYIGSGGAGDIGATQVISDRTSNNWIAFRNRANTSDGVNFVSRTPGNVTGFIGHSRAVSGSFVTRVSGSSQTHALASGVPGSATHYVFARNASGINAPTSGRLAWYSIGESLNLALLNARLTTYMAAIATPPATAYRRRMMMME
jgi:hypothetical protein